MKKLILFLEVFSFVLLISCKQNIFEEVLFRTILDPFDDVPLIDSFKTEKISYITWKDDDASDCFYLYRAEDQKNLVFECIYEGTDTTFIDFYPELSDNKRYIYRLDKKRGKKIFTGQSLAYGVCSTIRHDSFENNNTEDNATFLEYDVTCNLPCVKYFTNEKLYLDKDWFCITIPPMRTVELLVNQNGIDSDKETDLLFQVKGEDFLTIIQNNGINVTNSTYETKTVFFVIYPSVSKSVFSNESYSKSIQYNLIINKTIKYKID